MISKGFGKLTPPEEKKNQKPLLTLPPYSIH
jgi:hypothetical protein